MLSDYAEEALSNKMLRGTDWTPPGASGPYMSLHTADPGETGANELSGGPGPYARVQAAFDAWAAGIADNTSEIKWTGLPVTSEVVAVGMWDAASAGNALRFGWLGNFDWQPAIADDPVNDTITLPNHGFVDDDRVVFSVEFGGTLPAGLTAGTVYHVISSTTDTFKVSTTQGGGAVDITADGNPMVRKVDVKQIANSGDNFVIDPGDLDTLFA